MPFPSCVSVCSCKAFGTKVTSISLLPWSWVLRSEKGHKTMSTELKGDVDSALGVCVCVSVMLLHKTGEV